MRNKEESNKSLADVDIPALVVKLTEFPSREDAQHFLDEYYRSRKLLEPIARRLDIPITKQDKVEVLRDKIIEATVGARVRSQAYKAVEHQIYLKADIVPAIHPTQRSITLQFSYPFTTLPPHPPKTF